MQTETDLDASSRRATDACVPTHRRQFLVTARSHVSWKAVAVIAAALLVAVLQLSTCSWHR
jgi:hypothetical protein